MWRRLKPSMTCFGHGAPPVIMKRILPPSFSFTMCMMGPRMPIFLRKRAILDFSIPSSTLSRSFSARSGTPAKTVGCKTEKSIATVRSDSTNPISQESMRGTTRFTVNEKAWKSGRTTMNESRQVTVARKVMNAPSASVTKFLWVSIAPLGLPVVPDV